MDYHLRADVGMMWLCRVILPPKKNIVDLIVYYSHVSLVGRVHGNPLEIAFSLIIIKIIFGWFAVLLSASHWSGPTFRDGEMGREGNQSAWSKLGSE